MNFPSMRRLQDTYPSFDGFIEDFDPTFHLTVLDIRIQSNGIRSQIHFNDKNVQIDYFLDSRGCLVSWDKNGVKSSKIMEEVDFLNVAFKDFAALLKNNKEVLEALAMEFQFNIAGDNSEKEDNLLKLAENCQQKLSKLLMINGQKCPVKTFEMGVTSTDNVLELLTNLDPNQLKKLKITGVKGLMKRGDIDELDMEGVIKLELWKNLEELEIFNLWAQTSIQNLKHLKKLNISFKEITLDMVEELKQSLLNSFDMERFEISYEKLDGQNQWAELYGDPFEEKNRYGVVTWKWFFGIKDSKVLMISFVKNSIIFEHFTSKNIPKGAVIIQ